MLFLRVAVKTLVIGSLLSFANVALSCEHHKEAASEKRSDIKKPVQKQADVQQSSDSLSLKDAALPHDQNAKPQNQLLSVQVIDFVLTNKIEGREPKDMVEKFTHENAQGFAFARLSADKHAQITFIWLKDGREQSRFTTHVHASKRWRTYASTKLRPGNWKVQLLADNAVLAEREFIVE